MEFTTSEDGSNVRIKVHYIMYVLEVANRNCSHPPHRLYKTVLCHRSWPEWDESDEDMLPTEEVGVKWCLQSAWILC